MRGRKKTGRGQSSKNLNAKITVDLDKQASGMRVDTPDSLTYNQMNESIPRMGSTNRFDNEVFNVSQIVDQGIVLRSTTSLPAFFGLYFTASAHIQQFSTFASVFDQYRIRELEVWLEPTSLTGAFDVGQFKWASYIDYDDSATPASFAEVYSYSNCKVTNTANSHYWRFRPKIAVAAYQAAFTGYKNDTADWIDCNSGSVQHYGVKGGINATTSNDQFIITGTVRTHIQFRNVR